MDDKHDIISDELLAAFLDGNISEAEAIKVLSAAGIDKEVAETLMLSLAIDEAAGKRSLSILPMWGLAAANAENLCSFECEAFILERLDYDIDNWSLLETAKANNWLREEGTPLHHVGRLLELKGLHVMRKYDAMLEDIERALDENLQVIAIVDKNVMEGKPAGDKPVFHAVYVTGVGEDGSVEYLNLETLLEEQIDNDDFKKAWDRSSNYMIAASEETDAYNPQPINVEDIDLDADLEDLTEAIAENAHDIWARARMDEGWTYGPIRDDEKKQHPDLVPYAQLPDSEKEYDRIMAMNTLRLVRRLGFDITKQSGYHL